PMRSTDLLELLLCAVGSRPEIRRSLRVSEKNCCFAVRREILETWRSRLLHLVPTIDSGVAKVSKPDPTEALTAKTAANLSPDRPPTPQSTLLPIHSPWEQLIRSTSPGPQPHTTEMSRGAISEDLPPRSLPVPQSLPVTATQEALLPRETDQIIISNL